MRRLMFALPLLLAAAPILANTCEDSFTKKGNPFTGTTYSTTVSLPDLSVESTLGQLRGIAARKGMDILTEDAASGTMLIEEPESATHKSLPFTINAQEYQGTGRVEMVLKLNRGAFASKDGIKSAMCEMLAQLKSGKAGTDAAAAAHANHEQAEAIEITPRTFSQQIARQAKDNPAVINARYKDKRYRLVGSVASIRGDDGQYTVFFDDGSSPMDSNYADHVSVLCNMAPSQNAYALSLRKDDDVNLTGTFDRYDSMMRMVVLKGCQKN